LEAAGGDLEYIHTMFWAERSVERLALSSARSETTLGFIKK
jgi:hypothetical protein